MPRVTDRGRRGAPLVTVEVDVPDPGMVVVLRGGEPGGGWKATRGPGRSLTVPWRTAAAPTPTITNTKMPVVTAGLFLTEDNCSPGGRQPARASTGVSRARARAPERRRRGRPCRRTRRCVVYRVIHRPSMASRRPVLTARVKA